jgi:heme exporter protein D
MNLGPYASFIVAAYSLTILVIGALILWVLVDYRVQRKLLAELEARGVTRRSELPR